MPGRTNNNYSNGYPYETHTEQHSEQQTSESHHFVRGMQEQRRTPNRLILCFDGTGNSFKGNTSDTNIVKLYNKFDRSSIHQMHYYQPGIGTYPAEGGVNVGWFGRLKRKISATIDEGIATTFDAHVIAGYRFLMRYYGPGDRIYIFGFSRGAFTARFLARMVSQVGLLSMGNEEMVPFAYKTYQDYEMGVSKDDAKAQYIENFKVTFCRTDSTRNTESGVGNAGIKVHFLGLFDTVSSVGTLEIPLKGVMKPPRVSGTAEHIRHAVAIDERRVKFKPALLAQDLLEKDVAVEDVKEVWFAGNHGDVGGGWPAVAPGLPEKPAMFWERCKRVFFTKTDSTPTTNVSEDAFQLSDISLKWMIDELDKLPGDRIQWNNNKDGFLKHYAKHKTDAVQSAAHDTMKFGGGSSWANVIFWNLMEYLPFIKHWEYFDGGWHYITFPLNAGGTRDIPPAAVFHYSVLERMQKLAHYRPKNQTSIAADMATLQAAGVEVRSIKTGKESKLQVIEKVLSRVDAKIVGEVEAAAEETARLLRTKFAVHEKGDSEMDTTYHVQVERL